MIKSDNTRIIVHTDYESQLCYYLTSVSFRVKDHFRGTYLEDKIILYVFAVKLNHIFSFPRFKQFVYLVTD